MPPDVVTAPRKRMRLDLPELPLVSEVSGRLDLTAATLPDETGSALDTPPLDAALTLADLISSAPRRTLLPGESLFVEGQPARSMFAVQDGALEISRASADQPLATVKAGEWLGLFGLLAKRRRAATARALVSTEVAEVLAGPLVQLLTADPALRAIARRHFHERLARQVCGSHPLFQGLTRKAREQLAVSMKTLDLPADSHHVLVEETRAALYVVAHGQIRLSLPELSESVPLNRGQVFGLCAGSCALEAVTRVSLLELSPANCESDYFDELADRARTRGLLVDRQLFLGDVGLAGLA